MRAEFTRRILAVLAPLIPFLFAASTSAADPSAESLQATSSWKRHLEEVVTCRITARYFHDSFYDRKIPVARLDDVRKKYDLVNHPDGLADLLTDLLGKPHVGNPPWVIQQLFQDGPKISELIGTELRNVVVGPNMFRWSMDNRQVTLLSAPRTQISVPTIHDFRFTPDPEYWKNLDFQSDSADSLRISGSKDGLTVNALADPATGLIKFWHQDGGPGNTSLLVIQDGLTSFPGDIDLPVVSLRVAGLDGLINTLTVHIVEKAEFNIPLADDTFAMSAETGSVIVDYRAPLQHQTRLSAPVADVPAFMDSYIQQQKLTAESSPPPPPPPSDTPQSLGPELLILLGVALICISIFFWRKTRDRVPLSTADPLPGHDFT